MTQCRYTIFARTNKKKKIAEKIRNDNIIFSFRLFVVQLVQIVLWLILANVDVAPREWEKSKYLIRKMAGKWKKFENDSIFFISSFSSLHIFGQTCHVFWCRTTKCDRRHYKFVVYLHFLNWFCGNFLFDDDTNTLLKRTGSNRSILLMKKKNRKSNFIHSFRNFSFTLLLTLSIRTNWRALFHSFLFGLFKATKAHAASIVAVITKQFSISSYSFVRIHFFGWPRFWCWQI